MLEYVLYVKVLILVRDGYRRRRWTQEGLRNRVEFAVVDVYPRHISWPCNIFDHNLALNDGPQRLIEAVNVEVRKDCREWEGKRPHYSSNLSKRV